MLTGSQLVFLKDSTWALSLLDQIAQLSSTGAMTPGYVLSPKLTDFKADEVVSMQSAVALYDSTNAKVSFV